MSLSCPEPKPCRMCRDRGRHPARDPPEVSSWNPNPDSDPDCSPNFSEPRGNHAAFPKWRPSQRWLLHNAPVHVDSRIEGSDSEIQAGPGGRAPATLRRLKQQNEFEAEAETMARRRWLKASGRPASIATSFGGRSLKSAIYPLSLYACTLTPHCLEPCARTGNGR